jgi:hypothetical protein
MKSRRFSFGSICTALLVVVTATAFLGLGDTTGRTELFYTGSNDEEAAKLLVKALNRVDGVADVSIADGTEELITFTLSNGMRGVALCYFTEKLDRIDVSIGFGIASGKARDPQFLTFVAALNEKLAAKFSVLQGDAGASLQCSKSIPFFNHVRGDLVAAVIESLSEVSIMIRRDFPREIEMFLN